MIQVSCAIIRKSGKVLVARRNPDSSQALKWEFPGGKVESNETPEQCLHREIMEELGISIKVFEPLTPQDHDYGTYQIRLLPFLCEYESGEIELRQHAAVQWLSPSELIGLDWAPADIAVVEEFIHLR